MDDPIVAEIRALREQLAARFGYDIRAVVKDAQERDAAGDREVVRLPPRRPIPPPHKSPYEGPGRESSNSAES